MERVERSQKMAQINDSDILDALDLKRKRCVRKWTAEEDQEMVEMVMEHGTKMWGLIGSKLKDRTGKQCRERCVRAFSVDDMCCCFCACFCESLIADNDPTLYIGLLLVCSCTLFISPTTITHTAVNIRPPSYREPAALSCTLPVTKVSVDWRLKKNQTTFCAAFFRLAPAANSSSTSKHTRTCSGETIVALSIV